MTKTNKSLPESAKAKQKWCEHNRNIQGVYWRCEACNPTPTKTNKSLDGEWEKEFDERFPKDKDNKFTLIGSQTSLYLKAFIRQLLASQRSAQQEQTKQRFYDFYIKQHGEKLKAWNKIKNDIDQLLDSRSKI